MFTNREKSTLFSTQQTNKNIFSLPSRQILISGNLLYVSNNFSIFKCLLMGKLKSNLEPCNLDLPKIDLKNSTLNGLLSIASLSLSSSLDLLTYSNYLRKFPLCFNMVIYNNCILRKWRFWFLLCFGQYVWSMPLFLIQKYAFM